MKKTTLITTTLLLLLTSCSFEVPKTAKIKNGMGEETEVKVVLLNMENPISEKSQFDKVIRHIEYNNPCKHSGSFKPTGISIYNTNDITTIQLECMCQNSFGVYGEVNTYIKLDKDYQKISSISF